MIAVEEIEAASSETDKFWKAQSVKLAHVNLLQTLTAAKVIKTFQEWEEQR